MFSKGTDHELFQSIYKLKRIWFPKPWDATQLVKVYLSIGEALGSRPCTREIGGDHKHL